MKFTIEDIKDREKLEKMVEVEALQIFNSPVARKNRTLEEVTRSVRQGKVAELFLIESGEFFPANKKWHDLKDKNGDFIEVKAYDIYSSKAPSVVRDLQRLKEGWNISKWYILFKYNHGEYELMEKIQIR